MPDAVGLFGSNVMCELLKMYGPPVRWARTGLLLWRPRELCSVALSEKSPPERRCETIFRGSHTTARDGCSERLRPQSARHGVPRSRGKPRACRTSFSRHRLRLLRSNAPADGGTQCQEIAGETAAPIDRLS